MNKSWCLPSPSRRLRIVLGCTGSVATIKVPQLARKLKDQGCDIVIVPTAAACHFLTTQAKVENKDREIINEIASDNQTLNQISSDICNIKSNKKLKTNSENETELKLVKETLDCGRDKLLLNNGTNKSEGACSDFQKSNGSDLSELYPDLQFVVDHDEWESWQGRGDPVVHIELRKWAQILLMAPLDANTLAKLAGGLCDNLLTCIVRAWDPERPVIFCPAMNTFMYQHSFTAKHIAILKEIGMIEVPVVCKQLVCGDTGPGAMAEVDTIIDAVLRSCKNNTSIDVQT